MPAESLCWAGVREINERAERGTASSQQRNELAHGDSPLRDPSQSQPKDAGAASEMSEASAQAWFEDVSASMAGTKSEAEMGIQQEYDDAGRSVWHPT